MVDQLIKNLIFENKMLKRLLNDRAADEGYRLPYPEVGTSHDLKDPNPDWEIDALRARYPEAFTS